MANPRKQRNEAESGTAPKALGAAFKQRAPASKAVCKEGFECMCRRHLRAPFGTRLRRSERSRSCAMCRASSLQRVLPQPRLCERRRPARRAVGVVVGGCVAGVADPRCEARLLSAKPTPNGSAPPTAMGAPRVQKHDEATTSREPRGLSPPRNTISETRAMGWASTRLPRLTLSPGDTTSLRSGLAGESSERKRRSKTKKRGRTLHTRSPASR